MAATNVELSKNELELVVNSEFILTKNSIIKKVYDLFGALSESYKTTLAENKTWLPREIVDTSPKIYKGENYLQLPYVMMDYPRIFFKGDVFAIRSFFWWGNYFSVTLQLAGKYFEHFKNTIHHNLKQQFNSDLFAGVNDDMWQHHFETSNYKPLNEADIDELLEKPFIKIADKLSLNEWNKAPGFFEGAYGRLLALLM
ncbi:hypothetical protein [Parafilimonas sp.]|uniref:hypothetical protein n=1 Tax=Parafilimonas sp. TaxID=1969739 RepID=UPI0039E40D1A